MPLDVGVVPENRLMKKNPCLFRRYAKMLRERNAEDKQLTDFTCTIIKRTSNRNIDETGLILKFAVFNLLGHCFAAMRLRWG